MKNSLFDNVSAGSFTIILHVALFALIFIGMDFQSTTHVTAQPKVDIVQATAMDEADVLAEMTRQQEYEDDKRQQEQDRQDEIDKKLEQTEQELEQKKQEILEQEKQAELERQQRELEVQQKQEEIEKLEQQREIEAEKQLALEEENKQRIAKERLVEEERKQKIAEETRVAEEKKRLALADAKAAEQKKRDAEAAVRKAEEEKKKAEAKAKQDRIEKEKRVAKEKANREAAAAAKLKAERDARDAMAKRQMQEMLDAEVAEQETIRVNGVVNNYASRIRQRVKRYWIKPVSAERGLQCTLQVSTFPSGEVKQVKVIKSSGNALFDDSAERAVYKAEPLPLPPASDPKAAAQFKQFKFDFKPE